MSALAAVASAPSAGRAQSAGPAWTHEQDTDGDGVVDWRVRIWGSADRMTRQEIDEGADGTIDSITAGTYDAHGAIRSWLVDEDADGRWDRSVFYDYDTAGRRIRAEGDLDGDGAMDAWQTFDPPCEAPFDGCDVVPSC